MLAILLAPRQVVAPYVGQLPLAQFTALMDFCDSVLPSSWNSIHQGGTVACATGWPSSRDPCGIVTYSLSGVTCEIDGTTGLPTVIGMYSPN